MVVDQPKTSREHEEINLSDHLFFTINCVLHPFTFRENPKTIF